MSEDEVTLADVERLYEKLNKEAESAGYHLNPDSDFTKNLIESLIINEQRYGYQACPCRLASGEKEDDLDIICPCDYRDPDLNDFGACYCALYVSEEIKKGNKSASSIPERRPVQAERKKSVRQGAGSFAGLSKPVWRCKVCGYLCAREQPPDTCPVCKVKKDRFELFIEAA